MRSLRLSPHAVSAVLGIVLALQAGTTASMLIGFWILGLISRRVPGVPLLGAASLFAIIGGGVLLGRPSAIGRWRGSKP